MSTVSIPYIPLKTYRFQFQPQGDVRLPEYPGSAWRGAFGSALKKTVCVVRDTSCHNCLLKNACAYSYIFETPPPADSLKMRKYNAAPHPFVLQFSGIGQTYTDSFPINIHLFGHGQRYLPYIIHAMQKAGADGIGGQRQVFKLQTVTDTGNQDTIIYQEGQLQTPAAAASPAIPPLPVQIRIRLDTPLRIRHDDKNLGCRELNFSAFFRTLLRRISMISYFHTDTPLETDFAALCAQAERINFSEQQLKWYDWTRYSSRQQTEMNMGGLIGELGLDMQGLGDFWPYLWLGQWTHNGKGTSMGMGAYRIKAASLPSNPPFTD
ncbi:MAG: CRISPR system precrRNA processing endoribonuclease RAMP protein Cas6 [Methylomonas sp.]|jgi:hypothetical protein